MRFFFTVIAAVLTACSSSNHYKAYYTDYGNNIATKQNAEVIPDLVDTFDIKGKVIQYEKQGYVVLGVSNFDGEWEARTKAIDFAKSIGATLVITQSNLTRRFTQNYSITVPTVNTSYHSGTIYSANGYSNYSGTSRSYGSQQFNGAFTLGQYEQEAVFMVLRDAKSE